MEAYTTKAELILEHKDYLGCIIYVFKILDQEDINRWLNSYIMCVRYPNWNHGEVPLNKPGILKVITIHRNEDKYFRNGELTPYKYDNIQFIKFIPFPDKVSLDRKILID